MAEPRALEGVRVIVTGASRGVGRAAAIACARHGATVGVNFHRSETEAREVAATIGDAATLLRFDVGDPEAVRSAFDAFAERTGGIDALVNNAAIVRPSLLVSAGDEDVEALVRTNILGTIACTRAALGRMLAQRRGVILNIGSVVASSPCRGQAVYAATKAAVETLAAAVDAEYSRKGIRCECLALGAVATEMLAPTLAIAGSARLGRFAPGGIATPESVAENIVARLAARQPPAPSRTDLPPDALHALMESRRSVRTFRREMPPRELIESIIASAVTAPSASNKQPWRFLVVTSAGVIARMAAAVRAAVDRIAAAVEPEFEASFRAYGDYFTRFERAPVVIVPICRALTLLTNMTGSRLGSQDVQAIDAMERDSGLIGTSLALQNLLLAAHARGLGASGMTGPLVAAYAIRGILNVPGSWHVVALVPVGFPDEDPPPTTRKPASHVTQWID